MHVRLNICTPVRVGSVCICTYVPICVPSARARDLHIGVNAYT